MTGLINEAGDVALGWLRRNLLVILSAAAAMGVAHAELEHLNQSVEQAQTRLEALHRDFIEYRLSGSGVSSERFAEFVAAMRAADLRHDQALSDQHGRVLALEALMRRRLAEDPRETAR